MFPPGYCPGKLGGTQLEITVSNLTLLCVNTDGLTYGFIFLTLSSFDTIQFVS